jgi:hypothetical protein
VIRTGFNWIKMGFINWVLWTFGFCERHGVSWYYSEGVVWQIFPPVNLHVVSHSFERIEARTAWLTEREMLFYALHFVFKTWLCVSVCATYVVDRIVFWIYCTRHSTCSILCEHKELLSYRYSGNDFDNSSRMQCLLIISLRLEIEPSIR